MSHLRKASALLGSKDVRNFIVESSRYDLKGGLSYANSCLLRRWVSAFVPMAFDPQCLIDHVLPNPCSEPLHILMPELAKRRGAFWCGGTADTLTRVYRLFGFRAVSINIGNPEAGLSHMLSLVEIEDRGSSYVVPQDAYFNTTVVSSSGSFLDYKRIFATLRSRSAEELCFFPSRTKKIYLSPPKYVNGEFKKEIRTFYWDDVNWKSWLKSKSYDENLLYAYLFPFDIYEDLPSAGIKNEYSYMLGGLD